MARIIIFGGHGKIALLTEPLLVAQGDEVTAVIRNPSQADEVRAAGAEPLVADIERLDTAELAALITGHDAVVWSAGAGGGNPARTVAVDREAAIRSMDAAQLAGVTRYIMVSFYRSAPDHGLDLEHPLYLYAEAKSAADEHLRVTHLAWTILGPSTLTLEPASGRIDTEAADSGRVSRANVAEVLVATLADDTTIRRTIRFNDGAVPVAEAVRG